MVVEIFDRKLLKQNRARYAPFLANHSFLYHEIANRIVENLQDFERNFEDFLEIDARDEYLKEKLFESNKIKHYKHIEDDENITLSQEKFDLIISNMNLHHINFVPQFLLKVKNALKPGGIFIATFFGEENLPQLHKTIFETENEIYGGVSPRMIPTIDIKTAAALLQKAGFINPVSSLERVDVTYQDPLNFLKDLKMMGQGNVLNKRSRRFFSRRFLEKLLYNYRRDYNGLATFEIITITGWK